MKLDLSLPGEYRGFDLRIFLVDGRSALVGSRFRQHRGFQYARRDHRWRRLRSQPVHAFLVPQSVQLMGRARQKHDNALLSRSGRGGPRRGRLARPLGKPGEHGERAAYVATPAIRLDAGRERLRNVAPRLIQVAHLNETAQMAEKRSTIPPSSSGSAAASRTLDRTLSKAAASAASVGAPSATTSSGASFAGVDAKTLQPPEFCRKRRAAGQLVAQRRSDDGHRGGIVFGRGLLRRDAELAPRPELRFDLVEARGDAGEISRRRLRRAGFSFATLAVRPGISPLAASTSAAQILDFPRQGLSGLVRCGDPGRIVGVGCFQRVEALVDRSKRRSGPAPREPPRLSRPAISVLSWFDCATRSPQGGSHRPRRDRPSGQGK